jgi:hypothetical protein
MSDDDDFLAGLSPSGLKPSPYRPSNLEGKAYLQGMPLDLHALCIVSITACVC